MLGLQLIHVSKRGHWSWRHHHCIHNRHSQTRSLLFFSLIHGDVIKWKNFPRYWPFVRGIHRSPVNSPHKGQWRGALMFSLYKRLSKQSKGWWFGTPSFPLWRHCNVRQITHLSFAVTTPAGRNVFTLSFSKLHLMRKTKNNVTRFNGKVVTLTTVKSPI